MVGVEEDEVQYRAGCYFLPPKYAHFKVKGGSDKQVKVGGKFMTAAAIKTTRTRRS